jgi:hypothetical protein
VADGVPFHALPIEEVASNVESALFSVGAARSLVTGLSPFRSGVEMLLVGALAAIAAYLIGAFASAFTDTNTGLASIP